MNKRIAFAAIVIIAVALTVIYFIPTVSQKEVIVKASIINTVREISNPDEWKKWHPLLKTACVQDTSGCSVIKKTEANSFTIQTATYSVAVAVHGASFDITETGNNHYNYTVTSSLHDDTSRVIVTAQRSLLLDILAPSSGNTPAFQYADSLKKFIETPSAYYGFPLDTTGVTDTNVVTMHKKIPANKRAEELNKMHNAIRAYIQSNHLQIQQPPIAHLQPYGKDSIDVMTGIAVNKIAPPANNITCMQMPKGRMLVGYYSGPYSGLKNLYSAMNRYIKDKFMQKAASSFEKYIDNKVPESDSTQVSIKVYYPVF